MTTTYDPPQTTNGHTTDRHGRTVQVFNLRYLPGWMARRRGTDTAEGKAPAAGTDRAGGWLLAVASVLLLALAVAQGYVSYRAQYAFVHAEKGEHTASMLEALGLDAAAVIFALLALAQARLGRPAVAERALNLACVLGSLCMNALSADPGSAKSVAAWVMPAALYAAASDRLIAVVRRRALAGRDGEQDGSPLAAARGVALWTLRFGMAPSSTVRGFRSWVLDEAPVAPGRRALPARRDLPALPAPRATGTDTAPDNKADTTPDSQADKAARAPRPVSATRTATRPAPKRGTRPDKVADKARALLTADPDMTGAELGRRLKVSERTGSRLRNRLTASTEHATGTGTGSRTADELAKDGDS
ncbi:hypothetical protein ACGFNU_23495 [Spirillospora sp. NPDC048911]|uniref:hypothetical protein n=1 Tax=Spirillospora sp. NPDC048911 TaxID=3364527 RepID=UPI00371DA5C6